MLIFEIFNIPFFTWNICLFIMNFRMMILQKINFDIIWCLLLYICQYSSDHLISWASLLWIFYSCYYSSNNIDRIISMYVPFIFIYTNNYDMMIRVKFKFNYKSKLSLLYFLGNFSVISIKHISLPPKKPPAYFQF